MTDKDITMPPDGLYQSALEWIAEHLNLNNAKGSYQEIYPRHTIYRSPPRTCDSNVHWNFRVEYQHDSPPAYIAVLPGGRVWGCEGAVITPDNKLLADVSMDFSAVANHSVFQQSQLPPVDYVQDVVAVLASAGGNNYFHWMFDVLPRIDLLCRSGINVNKYIINKGGHLPFQRQTMIALGIPEANLIEAHEQFHLQADMLVVPSLPGVTGNPPKWACDFLKEEFQDNRIVNISDRYEHIYISRSNANTRKVLNETEVMDSLAEYGFVNVLLDSLTVADQALLLSLAKVVVAPHGAALSNLVFCNPGTKVIEFFSPNYVNVCFWALSNQLGLEYYYLLGQGERPSEYVDPHDVFDHITLNVEALADTLRLAGISKKIKK